MYHYDGTPQGLGKEIVHGLRFLREYWERECKVSRQDAWLVVELLKGEKVVVQ